MKAKQKPATRKPKVKGKAKAAAPARKARARKTTTKPARRRAPAFTPHLTLADPSPREEMSAREFLRLIDKLGLSQNAAARLLGLTGRTVRRWANGSPILPPAARFLRYLAKAKIAPVDVMETLAS